MTPLRDDSGAVLVFVAILFAGLLGLMAIAIDVGAWYQAQRNLQASADAAALAGAQDLPNTATATATATTYANDNATGLDSLNTTFPDSATIDVSLSKPTPGYFSRALGIDSVTVHGHARAQVGTPGEVENAVPIGIKSTVACATSSNGCFGAPKTLTFDDSTTTSFSSSSTFGLLDLSGGATTTTACNGNVGQGTQAGWVTSGFPGTLSVNRYYGATTGERIALRNALNAVIGQILLIPVFDSANLNWCTGAGGFHVIGWAAFVIDQTIPNGEWNPHVKILHGHFETFIAHDVVSTPGVPGFGVKVISLIQ